ncbi:rod shape-determining protein MreC [Brevibacillus laterosporus]|uniref:rod shape-determining protein MreC n=1 Tax=Brevibacillus laterosporus TaxID=1465 RepID=UPI000C76CAB9|nr:rod shape-determining protein MreC [Brevibacillus laterosporus]AUM64142.1 rod shape-determining protein MreC [Brevibacillus laterosporus]MDF9411219.1 rod shape-determining protein MreC [Brevibacillus laterosporus]
MSFFGNRKLIIVLIGLVVLLVVMGYTAKDRMNLTWPEKFMKDTTSVVQGLFYRPAQAVSQFVHNVQDAYHVYEENRVLKASLDQYAQMSAELKAVKYENGQLRESLGTKQKLNDYNVIYSEVAARNSSQWNDVLVIGSGSKQGVKKDMAVMTSKGLIGRVKDVSNFSATVELLTSRESSNRNHVSGYILATQPIQTPPSTTGNGQQTNGTSNTANAANSNKSNTATTQANNQQKPATTTKYVSGILEDYDSVEKLLIMRKIPLDQKISVNDAVITSGLGGMIPSKLPIGVVVKTEPGDYGLTQTAYIKPYADFTLISDVLVIDRKSVETPTGDSSSSSQKGTTQQSKGKGGK